MPPSVFAHVPPFVKRWLFFEWSIYANPQEADSSAEKGERKTAKSRLLDGQKGSNSGDN